MNFLKISPSVHFVLCTRRVSPLLRIMTRVRYYLCPVSQLSYIMNVAAVLHLCSRTTSPSQSAWPGYSSTVLGNVVYLQYGGVFTPRNFKMQKISTTKQKSAPLLVPWMVRAVGVIVRSPGPAPLTPASPPSSIFIGLSPRGNKHNLAQDHYTFASAVHCVNNTVNQLVGDTLLFIWNY